MKRWLPFVLFVVLVGFFAKGLFLNPREVPSPFIGRAAPAFTLPLVGDANAAFSPPDMKGKVWMLNVWAPWCVSCRQEHPMLMQIARGGRIPIVGLNWKEDTEVQDCSFSLSACFARYSAVTAHQAPIPLIASALRGGSDDNNVFRNYLVIPFFREERVQNKIM